MEVEEVLKGEVVTSCNGVSSRLGEVEDVLNDEIVSTNPSDFPFDIHVEEALNDVIINSTRVDTGERMRITSNGNVILSEKDGVTQKKVGEILKGEVISTRRQKLRQETQVKEILDTVAVSDVNQMFILQALAQEVLKNS
jgi:hypothetical protein